MFSKYLSEVESIRRHRAIDTERVKVEFLQNMISAKGRINEKVYPTFEMQLLSSKFRLKRLLNDA
jgi:hypothetical protein